MFDVLRIPCQDYFQLIIVKVHNMVTIFTLRGHRPQPEAVTTVIIVILLSLPRVLAKATCLSCWVPWQDCFQLKTGLLLSNLCDTRNSIAEIPKVRVLLREWWITLPLYAEQCVQGWGNACSPNNTNNRELIEHFQNLKALYNNTGQTSVFWQKYANKLSVAKMANCFKIPNPKDDPG